MSATLVRETQAAYRRLRRFVPLGELRSEKDYQKAVAILDEIIDEIGQNEALALFIHSYEETHAKIREATGPEVLRSLMEEHGLTQSELPELGSQGVVSEILSGERELKFDRSAAWGSDSASPPPSLSPHEIRQPPPSLIIPGFRMNPAPEIALTRFGAGVHGFWKAEKDLPVSIVPSVLRTWNDAVVGGYFV